MINEGTAGDEQWPDTWTVVTRDGKRSAQFEHTMIVTETGVELLTARKGASSTAMIWDEVAVQAPLALAGGGASGSSSGGGGGGGSSSAVPLD